LEPILEVLRTHMPDAGCALEIASGTGQHCAAFSEAFPAVQWQPTDVEPERLSSINAWAAASGVANMRPAVQLNVEQAEWPFAAGSADVIMLVNLLHLISDSAADATFKGAARMLAAGGQFFFYGPFLRDGAFASEGDASFHASLRQQDPAIGYKDVTDIARLADAHGFDLIKRRDMPANNLMFTLERRANA
jgi:cyclopropane fatty-acyl-phospholipid synthase-like methyltransferase